MFAYFQQSMGGKKRCIVQFLFFIEFSTLLLIEIYINIGCKPKHTKKQCYLYFCTFICIFIPIIFLCMYLQQSVICTFNENTEEYNVKTSENDVQYSNFNMGEIDKSRELYSKREITLNKNIIKTRIEPVGKPYREVCLQTLF